MLVVNGVTKKYKKFLANDNLSFTIGDGEIGVLLGPNGAGKSTIIKSIAGLLRYEGDIEICGEDNHTIEAKRLLGYVPEMPALYDTLTIDEHLEFIRRAYKVEDTSIKEKLLERFELTDKRKKMGKELSKGMQQKVSICCALLHDPKVVIFDEPMVGLDPHAIKELKALFQELKAQGKTVLISTHMIDTIEDYWDVAHIMMNGRIAATKHNRADSSDEKSLDELFFQITEGKSSDEAKKEE
ncbi:MAG: ABC transporter ATP-binding protein [Saccharofermentans sp.]|nr:ABC transporter ATP-binding protein [Saccharofermentans sp.]